MQRQKPRSLFPLYSRDSTLAEKIVKDAHMQKFHGGVNLTMTEVQREYWIPRLRSLTKKVRKACHGCKRFQVTAFNNPPPGKLLEDRAVGSRPSEVELAKLNQYAT